MIQTFSRYEEKYIIHKDLKAQLEQVFNIKLIRDSYAIDGPYTIYSHYFDSTDYQNIKTSIAKPSYKEKLRMRSYKYPLVSDDIIFLEIKKKFRGKVNKRRLYLRYIDYLNYINHQIKPTFESYYDQQMIKMIDYMMTTFHLKPSAMISYDREAYYMKDSDLRITFDSNIKFHNHEEHALLIDDYYVLEIKTSYNFPLWLTQVLTSLNIYKHSFSKYGTAYQKIISKETYYNKSSV